MDSSCDFYFHQKSDLRFMAEEDFAEGAGFEDDNKSKDLDDSRSCSSESSSIASGSSMEDIEEEEGEEEEVSSSSSSSSNGPLQDMSPLLQQLPFKRGLSRHYQGKSQSFTSLANVVSLEDLAKPENPYNKKLKSCRSYACGLSDQSNQGRRSSPPSSFSRIISKKASRGSCFYQMNAKRSSGFRPPMPPHRSTSTSSISNQTALFA